MKITWSAFLLLFLVVSCGSEQFGTSSQSTSSQADGLKSFEQLSCSTYTLIKPKVDILYVVDNSTSTYYIASDIQNAIKNTVDSISKQFDYRMIGTTLLPIDSTPYDDYQLMTNSSDALTSAAASRKVISSSELSFFSNTVSGGNAEFGLRRSIEFMNANSGSLFRQGAYHLIVLISNGRDTEVETASSFGNGETTQNASVFNARLASFRSLKSNLQSQQLRLFSVTARTSCHPGWLSSQKSYVQMSSALYADSGAVDSQTSLDSYDLCSGGIASVFTAVNNSIKQVVVPHVYRYWPITFAENNAIVSLADLQVFKSTNGSAPALLPSSAWTYYKNTSGGPLITQEPPISGNGDPVTGTHFVRFTDGNLITYPDCVQVKSVSRTEYFGYVVLPKDPKVATVVIRINGRVIPQSATDGWSYIGAQTSKNIKVPYPNAGDDLPAVLKTGFMIQLNGSANYYKSGDNVEAYYLPAGV